MKYYVNKIVLEENDSFISEPIAAFLLKQSGKTSFDYPYRYVQTIAEKLVSSDLCLWKLPFSTLKEVKACLTFTSCLSSFPTLLSSQFWCYRRVHRNSPSQLSNTYRLKSKRGKETLPKASGLFLCLLESGELPLLWFKIPKRVRWRRDSNGNCDIWMGKIILEGKKMY